MNKSKRLDILLVEHKYCESRNKANYLIKNGFVSINKTIVVNPSKKIDFNNLININICNGQINTSRGFKKLEKAIIHFNININGSICLDIGSSTGGFVECLLLKDAKKIYAIDSGKGQLHKTLKTNERVISFESTNFIKIDKNLIANKINFICCDVSFISSKKIIKKIIDLNWKDFEAIFLFKPQFEVGKKIIDKTKGYVNEKMHINLIQDFIKFLSENNFDEIKYIESPITGKKMNNKEYLFYMKMAKNE